MGVNKVNINSPRATVILLVAFAVLSGISAAIRMVDVAQLPQELQTVWQGLSYVFLTSAAAPLFVFIRNIYGYWENKVGTDPEKRAQVKYEASQLWSTWLKYEGYMKAISVFIIAFTDGTKLAPYAVYIAGAITFIVDLIRKSLSDLKEKE